MTNLFDIANIITTVGIDGVKIKSEPGLPEKSSNEILTELFSTFDAATDDGIASPLNNSQIANGNIKDTKSLEKFQAKKKKIKRKHKHKEKKHKKKSKHNSSDSNSDVEDGIYYIFKVIYNIIIIFASLYLHFYFEGIKKKKKHKKKSKRKYESISSISSDSDSTKAKMIKLNNDLKNIKHCNAKLFDLLEKNDTDNTAKIDNSYLTKNLEAMEKIINPSSPQLPPILRKTDDEFDEPIIPKLLGLYLTIH